MYWIVVQVDLQYKMFLLNLAYGGTLVAINDRFTIQNVSIK